MKPVRPYPAILTRALAAAYLAFITLFAASRAAWASGAATHETPAGEGAPGLVDVYREAAAASPELRAAAASVRASEAGGQAARAGLMPHVNFSTMYTSNQTQEAVAGTTAAYAYGASSTTVTAQQPLYRPTLMADLDQAQSQQHLASAQLEAQRQQLLLQAASTYLAVLQAQDRATLAQGAQEAYRQEMEQALRLLRAGEGTRTDVDDAQVRLTASRAQAQVALGALAQARAGLRQVLGRVPVRLRSLELEAMPMGAPQPCDEEAWAEDARHNSPAVRIARDATTVATHDSARARAAYAPTVDLIAARSWSASGSDATIGQAYDTSYVGVQLQVALFDAAQAPRRDQALAREQALQEQEEAARRKAELDARQDYAAVQQALVDMQAQAETLRVMRRDLESTRKGVQGGTRTLRDVLMVQQQLDQGQREMLDARYRHLASTLRLKSDVGRLDEQDLQAIDAWLRD